MSRPGLKEIPELAYNLIDNHQSFVIMFRKAVKSTLMLKSSTNNSKKALKQL